MYVVMNELNIPKEQKQMITSRFANSADNMKKVPGCLEFMFLGNEDENGKQVVFTKWESKDHYEAWTNSESFKKAHGGKSRQESSQEPSANTLNEYTVIHHT